MATPAEQQHLLVSWLQARAPDEEITTGETHISLLAFQGDRVYKLKKAVRFPFIDLSTASKRLADCRREVDLNRRIAPDVYLGVEAIVGDNGETLDHVVVMRRMPEDRRLSALARRGNDAELCIDRVAQLLVGFHERAATGDRINAAASRDAVALLWERELSEFVGSDEIRPLVETYLRGRRELFDARVRAGRSRDGHGDLLADDVFCLDDGPRVLDCLEFDEQLRFGDVLLDVAFLAMDLDRLGRGDLARRLLDGYRALSSDSWPRSLEHFYVAYRAHVRAKVAMLNGDEAGSRERLALALDHLRRGRVRLVLVGGPPATGKSTVARAIADASGWPVIRSDEVRRELSGASSREPAPVPFGEGIYDAAWTDRTYAELLERAGECLVYGEPVILDASWSDELWRGRARALAQSTASDLVELKCSAPLEVAMARADARLRHRRDVSDADAAIVVAASERFAPWPGAVNIDTTQTRAEVERIALTAIGPS
jgi:aminoglycoside phosphotransferase family enzyme/predicted kinase